MTTRARTILAAFAISILAATGAGPAGAATDSQFGQHVASCAHSSLGQRADPPSITCTHDGMTMTFSNFGAMVRVFSEPFHGSHLKGPPRAFRRP